MRTLGSLALLAGGAWLSACSSGSGLSTGGLAAADALPRLPDLPALSSLSIKKVTGSPTEVYTRIARGAVTCWFGSSGPLKGRHIYHADAEPESKGGGAEITVFQKDQSKPDPRALKAFWIGIVPTGEIPRVEVQNFKIAEPLASRLQSDVDRWAAAEEGCGETPVTQGWTPKPPAAPSKKKSAAKRP